MRSYTFYGRFGTGNHSFGLFAMFGHALCLIGGMAFVLPAPAWSFADTGE